MFLHDKKYTIIENAPKEVVWELYIMVDFNQAM